MKPRYHYRGKYVIKTEWQGRTLVYDIFTKDGLRVAAGFDGLSPNEETALEGIVSRLFRKGESKAA